MRVSSNIKCKIYRHSYVYMYINVYIFFFNTHLDVVVVFGGRLEELNVQLVGQRFAPLVRYDAFVFHVALVAHQYNLRVVPRVRLDLRDPVKDTHARTLSKIGFTDDVAPGRSQGEYTSLNQQL